MKVWKMLCLWLKWQVFSQLLGPWGSADTEGLRGQVACAALLWGLYTSSFCFSSYKGLRSFAAKGHVQLQL